MITTYERRGIRKGLQKGRREGLREGLVEGKQTSLILQLEKKFGKLDTSTKRKIQRIESVERLESLLLAVLDAQSLDQLGL